MLCDTPKTQLYLYLDGELAPPEAAAVAQHLQTCAACQREAAAHHRLQTLLRSTLTQEEVPEQLWASIRQRLPGAPVGSPRPARRVTRQRLWISLGAVAALLVLAFGVQTWLAFPVSTVVQEIVASQIRTRLMEAAYKEIPAEPGEIRRWFQDKVEFSVLVPDLPTDRYAFLGVRLNYFLDRRVAEIAYASRGHVLSFLMFANTGIPPLTPMRTVHAGGRVFYVQKYKGYNTVLWKDGDFFCSLVSDLHLPALLQIAREATGSSSAS